jgi:flagellar capping protein FliD
MVLHEMCSQLPARIYTNGAQTVRTDPLQRRIGNSPMAVLLKWKGKCSCRRAKLAHVVSHLPPLATKQEIQALETKIATVETTLGTRIGAVETRLETKIAGVETELKKSTQSLEIKIAAVETRVEKSEQTILTKLDQLEKLSADYLDGQVQTIKRRLDRVEKHLNLTP